MSERVVAVFQDLVLTYDRWLGADVQAGEVLEAAFRSLEVCYSKVPLLQS